MIGVVYVLLVTMPWVGIWVLSLKLDKIQRTLDELAEKAGKETEGKS